MRERFLPSMPASSIVRPMLVNPGSTECDGDHGTNGMELCRSRRQRPLQQPEGPGMNSYSDRRAVTLWSQCHWSNKPGTAGNSRRNIDETRQRVAKILETGVHSVFHRHRIASMAKTTCAANTSIANGLCIDRGPEIGEHHLGVRVGSRLGA